MKLVYILLHFWRWLLGGWLLFGGGGETIMRAMVEAHDELCKARGRMNIWGKPRVSVVVRTSVQRRAGRVLFIVVVKERF